MTYAVAHLYRDQLSLVKIRQRLTAARLSPLVP
jgi:hypothetical protein